MRLPSAAATTAAVASASSPPRPVAQAPPPVGAFLASSHRDLPADDDPWAPDPVLDGAMLDGAMLDGAMAAGLASAGPAAHDAEAEAAAEAATALQESGFGSALHTALGELRRITDDPAPVHAGAVVASSEAPVPRMMGQFDPAPGSGPHRPSPQPESMVARRGGTPAEWLASLGDWWTARWKELLPGMVVVTLVVIAFAVVLASGGRRANTSHVDSRRPLASDPPTTIAGLFTTASVPPGDVPPPGGVPPSDGGPSAGGPSAFIAPPTTKPSSDGPAASSTPTKASNPSASAGPSPTSPPNTSPPSTDPPVTDPPITSPPSTSPPTTSPPDTTVTTNPPSTVDICVIRPSRC